MKNSILFLSAKGETLSVAHRLLKEGVPIDYYLHDSSYSNSYKNIFTRLNSFDGLMAAVKRADVVVVDTIAKNNKTDRDHALLDLFRISHNVSELYGPIGAKIKRMDKVVINGGEDDIAPYELDRAKGVDLARKAGFSIPPYQDFKNLRSAIKFLRSPEAIKRDRWFFKADGNQALDLTFDGTPEQLIDYLTYKVPKRLGTDQVDCIIQEAVEGDVVELSREGWRLPDGTMTNPNSTLEDKKLHSRKSGPRVGSAVNTVWRDKDFSGPIHKQLVEASKHLGDFCGAMDANCILTKDGQPWFLEWTIRRFGYSALYLLLTFIKKGKLGNFFLDPFKTSWKDGFVASQVLSLYPFPPTAHNRKDFVEMIAGNPIDGKIDELGVWWVDVMEDAQGNLRVNGADGLIGVATAHDDTMEGAIKKAYEKVDGIKIVGNKQFWPLQEHLDSHTERYTKLQKWGII